MKLTVTMVRALRSASLRVGGNLCPIAGVRGSAETALLRGLDRRGLLVDGDGPIPRINDAGRKVLALVPESEPSGWLVAGYHGEPLK